MQKYSPKFDKTTCVAVKVDFPHKSEIWRDENGVFRVRCRSSMEGGGIAIAVELLDWYRNLTEYNGSVVLDSKKEVRFSNERSGLAFDGLVGDLPQRPITPGRYGPCYIYDAGDLETAHKGYDDALDAMFDDAPPADEFNRVVDLYANPTALSLYELATRLNTSPTKLNNPTLETLGRAARDQGVAFVIAFGAHGYKIFGEADDR